MSSNLADVKFPLSSPFTQLQMGDHNLLQKERCSQMDLTLNERLSSTS